MSNQTIFVHELFKRQATQRPNEVAAVCDDQMLRYRELDVKASLLAARLNELGVGPDKVVGILLPRSLDMVVALIGILKAGGSYLPLDPTHPEERLGFMLADSGAEIVVTHAKLQSNIKTQASKVLFIDQPSDERAQNEVSFTSQLAPSNLAYVIYTSGSTGKPKGVEIPHKALSNFIFSMQKEPGLTSADTLLAVTTLSFDIAGLELLLPLSVGAKIVIADHETVRDGIRLRNLFEKSKPTVMQATPATWKMLIDAGWRGDQQLKALCGGESLSKQLAQELLTRCGSLWNMYGPTETTIWSTLHQVSRDESAISIGRPVLNTDIHILNDSLAPVQQGEVGELFIGGDGLARGYRNRPELTSERFIVLPSTGRRVYRTGDLAKYRADGLLECLGRVDSQVKVRGFRIELGEIENSLSTFVKDIAVSVHEDAEGEKHLVAYVVPHAGKSFDSEALKAAAQKQLPSYMLPGKYVILTALPLTPNGKVDRKQLPKPDFSGASIEIAHASEPPVGEIETRLADLWKQVLNLKAIGRNDNFMAAGGNSITLTRLSRRISEVFDVDVQATSLYRRPTIQQMAELIVERQND